MTSLSATDQSGVSQAVTAWSPTITWQAPHSPAPQTEMRSDQAKLSAQDIEQQAIGIGVDLGSDAIEAKSRGLTWQADDLDCNTWIARLGVEAWI